MLPRLSVDESLDFDALKTALLKRFQLTEEGFRSKFRNSKAEMGETPQQFVVRLDDYLLRWMDLAKVSKDFEGLKDLVLREQFMQASSKPLQIFLKERKVESVKEMAELAEQYQEAHGGQSITPGKGLVQRNPPSGYFSNAPPDKIRHCYICRDSSHIARDCPKQFVQQGKVAAAGIDDRHDGRYMSRSGHVGRGGGRGGSRGSRGGRGGGYGRGSYQSDNRGDGRSDVRTGGGVGCLVQGKLSDISGDRTSLELDILEQNLPIISVGNTKHPHMKLDNMPVAPGFVNGKQVQVLRDSGCSSAVVRRDLVEYECLTGKSQSCVLLDGTVRKSPVATVFIKTLFILVRLKPCVPNTRYMI